MLEAGIYVPEQDASWEREGGHYEVNKTLIYHITRKDCIDQSYDCIDQSLNCIDQSQEVDAEPVRLCHAKLCFCDHDSGRAHHSQHGLWEILKCDTCGHKVLTNQKQLYTS